MKDFYITNYKTLLKEIKEDVNKWKDVPGSQIERHNIVKMSVIPRASYRYNGIFKFFFSEK